MFYHNRVVLDKKTDLLFSMADKVGRGEVSKGQKRGKVHSHHACLGLDEDEWNMEGGPCCYTSNQFTSSALPIGVPVYGFPIHHNPVWKQMFEVRRYESVVETIPGMELEVNCKLTENTKAKPKDGTVTEKLNSFFLVGNSVICFSNCRYLQHFLSVIVNNY